MIVQQISFTAYFNRLDNIESEETSLPPTLGHIKWHGLTLRRLRLEHAGLVPCVGR